MLVVIATKDELPLVDECGLKGNPVLITGVGGVNVIKALRDVPKDTEILNIGYCGAQGLDVGTFINVVRVSTYHKNVDFSEFWSFPTVAQIGKLVDKNAVCYTSTDFVTEKGNADDLQECVFDMELAFICALGFEHVASIKKVSDNLSVNQYKEYLDNKDKRG